jgi:hypothetical protein
VVELCNEGTFAECTVVINFKGYIYIYIYILYNSRLYATIKYNT